MFPFISLLLWNLWLELQIALRQLKAESLIGIWIMYNIQNTLSMLVLRPSIFPCGRGRSWASIPWHKRPTNVFLFFHTTHILDIYNGNSYLFMANSFGGNLVFFLFYHFNSCWLWNNFYYNVKPTKL